MLYTFIKLNIQINYMISVMAGEQLRRRWDSDSEKFFGVSDEVGSFGDIVFGFLEDQEVSLKSSCNSIDYNDQEDEDDNSCNVKENKRFWETQNELIQDWFLEMRLRRATKAALNEIKQLGLQCGCHNPKTGECRSFLQREVSIRLQAEGYNCSICKSKWKSSPEIPSGEHTYLEVVEKLNSKKGEVRVVIELNFRAEFEMARASQEYNQLINRLPEIFVGKEERLKALIKILCSAGKKCMKEKKMHLGPWRKHKYMQSKWLGTCERTTLPTPLLVGFSDRTVKPKASLLTCDMLDSFPVLHCTAVKVL